MKKFLTILAVVFFVGPAWAQTTEYLPLKDFKVEKQKISDGINATRKQVNEVKKGNLKTEQSIDSLKLALTQYAGQLAIVNDSLSAAKAQLNALQEKVDNQKFLSKGMRILIIVILLLLFTILFVLLFLFKKKAEMNHLSLVDLDKKTNERMDLEMNNSKAEIQTCRDLIGSNASEMNQRISAGMKSIEASNNQIEQKLKDSLAVIGGRIDIIGPEISKIREEHSSSVKALEDKLNALKKDADQKNHDLAAQVAKLEEEIRLIKGKH